MQRILVDFYSRLFIFNYLFMVAVVSLAPHAFAVGEERIQVEMLRDISPGSTSSSPTLHTVAGTRVFFSANISDTGSELWVSDGSYSGTCLVKDIRPGTSGSSILGMTALGSRVFFTANDGTHGKELWRSDGTESGTYLLKDIYAGTGSGAPAGAKTVLGALFFPGLDSGTGLQPWTSDGTTPGTMLLKRINNEGDGLNVYSELDAVEVPELGLGFFQGYSGKFSGGLWKSNGTTAGTLEITTFLGGYMPVRLTACNGLLFFVVNSTYYGYELWATDGTTAGTNMVKDIIPGVTGSNPRNLVCCDDVLYFYALDSTYGLEPWRSDGTEAGTWMLADIAPGYDSSSGFVIACMEEFLILIANHPVYGRELWRVNRDGSDPALIKDVNPSGNSCQVTNKTGWAVLNGILYIQLDDGVHGAELWRTDGTEEGTWMVADIDPGIASSWPLNMTVIGDNLFFTASNGTYGTEQWILRYLPFRFTLQPAGKRLEAGNPVTLRVAVENAIGEVAYQWFYNDEIIPDAFDSEYSIEYAAEEDTGWYYCQATDSTDTMITSAEVYLAVLPENSLPLSKLAALLSCGLLFLCFICFRHSTKKPQLQ